MMASLIPIGTGFAPFLLQAAQTNPGGVPADQLGQQIALEAVRHNPATSPVSILVPISLFAMILGIFWLKWRQQQAQFQTKAEFHKQLLDKFASGRDFAEFLESKGSQRFLEDLWSQGGLSKEKSLRNGILVAMLGLAFLGLSWMKRDFLIPGVLLLALGAGFLIFFAISYRLSKGRYLGNERDPENFPVSQN
jgi:hypothetical protein